MFWEVAELRPLETPILIAKMRGSGGSRTLAATFKPEGPILIDNPV